MKLLEVLPTEINEIASYDYTDMLKSNMFDAYRSGDDQIWPWQLQQLGFRA